MTEKILFFSDLHFPYHHPSALKFLQAVKQSYRPTLVICGGDEVDNHAVSYHESDPNLSSASDELALAKKYMKKLYKIFPKCTVLHSNHGSLYSRKAKTAGFPQDLLKPWNELMEAPKGWNWVFDYTYKMSNGRKLYCHHGISTNAFKVCWEKQICYIQGHYHSQLTSHIVARHGLPLWGVTSGCLVDHEKLAFEYQKNNLKRPQLGVTMIINGYPHLIPMKVNKNNRWVGKL